MIRQLGPVTPAAELAAQLNAAGLTTERPPVRRQGRPELDPPRHHIPAPAAYADGEISVAEAARRLGCSTSVSLPLDPHRGS